MVSNESLLFLKWLRKQDSPVSHATMRASNAPAYSPQRIESLCSDGLVKRTVGYEISDLVSVHALSDKGLAAIQAHSLQKKSMAVEWIRYGITTAIAVVALVRTFL